MNRFAVSISASPSGLVKVSQGLGARKTKKAALSAPTLALVPNFKSVNDSTEGEMYVPSSDCPSIPELKAGWGLLGKKSCMSKKTSKGVRERMCAVELEYGIDKCRFITLTLPSDDTLSFEMLARYSAYAVNRISQFLRDGYFGVDFSRVGVWEYQQRGAPHYHMLLGSHCMDAINIDVFRSKIAAVWMSILESIERETGINCFRQEGKTRDKDRLLDYDDLGVRFANVQVVEKSVSAYLASYLATSNHDSGKDKNGLRKRLFPFGTWAQWDRSATALFKKYSIEFDTIIWAEDFDTWSQLKDILFASIEPAEDTEKMTRKNPFYESSMVISAKKGESLLNILEDFLEIFRSSGIISTFGNTFRYIRKKSATRAQRLSVDIHDADFLYWEHCQSRRGELEKITNKVTSEMNGLLLLMLECEQLVELHKSFSPALQNVKQLEIKHGY